jgi:hypothetical protein
MMSGVNTATLNAHKNLLLQIQVQEEVFDYNVACSSRVNAAPLAID